GLFQRPPGARQRGGIAVPARHTRHFLGAGGSLRGVSRPAGVFRSGVREHFRRVPARQIRRCRPPGAIVVAGRPALEFVLRHRGLLGDVSIVHLAVDKAYLEAHPTPPGVTGVPIVYDFAGTIELALRLHPRTRRVVVVTGSSASDRSFEAQVRSGVTHLRGMPPVEYVTALPTAAVLARLRELGDGDVVFTTGYFGDGTGRVFVPRDTAAVMAAESGAPLYGPFATFIGTGAVGGRMGSYVDIGRLAGQTVKELLAGTPLAALKMPASVP